MAAIPRERAIRSVNVRATASLFSRTRVSRSLDGRAHATQPTLLRVPHSGSEAGLDDNEMELRELRRVRATRLLLDYKVACADPWLPCNDAYHTQLFKSVRGG